jgi:hypothetical protein
LRENLTSSSEGEGLETGRCSRPVPRQSFTRQKALLHLTLELQCEIHTLGYPRAALFGFACAAVAFNTLGVVKAALRAAHGAQRVDEEVSGYY